MTASCCLRSLLLFEVGGPEFKRYSRRAEQASIWLIKRSKGCFPVYSGRIRFGKSYHWLLVAVYVGICLKRPSTVAVKLLVCSLVALWLLSVPPVQPCVPSVDF